MEESKKRIILRNKCKRGLEWNRLQLKILQNYVALV